MRILLKCPTRERRFQFLTNLRKWVELANHPEQLGILVSCDTDDTTMQDLKESDLPEVAWKKIAHSPNKSKIEACNANMNEIDWNWQIVILVSDDMAPEVKGQDDRIREAFPKNQLDFIVWINDGIQGINLNTLNIFGRTRQEDWGYLQHPSQRSFFCDNEVTDWCRDHPTQCTQIPEVLVRHQHPVNGTAPMDKLQERNQVAQARDEQNYRIRKTQRGLGFLKLLSRR